MYAYIFIYQTCCNFCKGKEIIVITLSAHIFVHFLRNVPVSEIFCCFARPVAEGGSTGRDLLQRHLRDNDIQPRSTL